MDAFFLVTVKPKCEVRHNNDSICKVIYISLSFRILSKATHAEHLSYKTSLVISRFMYGSY